jgi:hypothetical protein
MPIKPEALTKTLVSAAIVVLLSGGIVATTGAAEIYKWTDADGNVQYGDRPSGAAFEERLQIASNRSDSEQPATPAVAPREEVEPAEQAAEDKKAKGPTRAELRAAAQEKTEKCNSYRERLNNFVRARHLYREDESGERVYLDEAATQAAREKVQGQVEEYCGA